MDPREFKPKDQAKHISMMVRRLAEMRLDSAEIALEWPGSEDELQSRKIYEELIERVKK